MTQPDVPQGPPTAEQEFARIDAIRSISDLMGEVDCLPEDMRRTVILMGLERSTTQFTWSFIAKRHRVATSDWPPNPHEARDPARIEPILDALRQVWQKCPDLRLGQIVSNAARGNAAWPDVFNVEDDEVLRGLNALIRPGDSSRQDPARDPPA